VVENYPFGGTDFLFFAKGFLFGTGPKSDASGSLFHVEHLPSHRLPSLIFTLTLTLALALTLALFHVEQFLAQKPESQLAILPWV
jgi:hypothetical protein